MKEFTLKRSEKKEFKVNIDGKSYVLPLSVSLPIKEIKALDTAEGTLAFIHKYIPAKVIESLTQEDYNSIVNAWVAASKEESGLSVGEK